MHDYEKIIRMEILPNHLNLSHALAGIWHAIRGVWFDLLKLFHLREKPKMITASIILRTSLLLHRKMTHQPLKDLVLNKDFYGSLPILHW